MNNLKQVEIKDVTFGKNCTVIKPVNLYGCVVGDDTFIGPFVEIQKNCKIGKNCKIQSHSFLCELLNIGDNCFIGHGVMFINDNFSDGGPAKGNTTKWKRTNIKNNVYIGSNATILPVDICENVVIGAGAVVTKNIIKSGIYAGNPAKLIREL